MAAEFAHTDTDTGLVYDDYVASHMDERDFRRLNRVAKLLGVRGEKLTLPERRPIMR